METIISNPLNNSLLSKLKNPTRQARLESWMALHGITRSAIAVEIGVTKQYVGQILSGQKTPQNRLEQLAALGIPQELLPKPNGKSK